MFFLKLYEYINDVLGKYAHILSSISKDKILLLHIFDKLFEVNFYVSNNSQSQCQCLIWIQQNGSLLQVNCQPYTIHFNWRLCCSIIELNNWRGWFQAHWITLLIPDNLHILFLISLLKLRRCFSHKSKNNFLKS